VTLPKEDGGNARILRCARCDAEVGRTLKGHSDIFQFYHAVTQLSTPEPAKSYVTTRFGTLERYFAWLMLSRCETDDSLKLLIRTFDRRPHLLIWLLESYVVLTNGNLSEEEDDDSRPTEISDTIESATDYHNGNVSPSPPVGGSSIAPVVQKDEDPNCNVDQSVHSFPALKMLYKVFDANSAVSDPRVNGQDASVSIVELPSGACLRLTEILLQSSHALPPACRSVGQFFVGFLKLKDTLM